MRYYLTPVKMAIINKSKNNKCWRGYREKEILLHCWWECILSHYGKKYGSTSEINIKIPYNPEPPLLGIYQDKTFIQKDTCASIFIASLFTIAKAWKQPKCPLTDEQTKKVWYTYTMGYFSAIKKNKKMLFPATWMELEILILSEVRKIKTNTA